MAGWWKDRRVLAAILILPVGQGCGMMDTQAGAQRPVRGAALFDLVRAFLADGDPLALLEKRGAVIDNAFAANGQYLLEIPGTAERGSSLTKKNDATTLTLVVPATAGVVLADVTGRLGEATRLPAMPGTTWQYGVNTAGGRVVAVLNADPKSSSSRVTKLTAIRAR